MGEELTIQTVWILGENCEDEPWKHLPCYCWMPSFHNDRSQEFCVHQGNPIKEFSGGCKALRAQGVGWWSPGFRVDLLAGLTCLLPGTCGAAAWVKPVCPAPSFQGKEHTGCVKCCLPESGLGHTASLRGLAYLQWLSPQSAWNLWEKVGSSRELSHPGSTHWWLTRFQVCKLAFLVDSRLRQGTHAGCAQSPLEWENEAVVSPALRKSSVGSPLTNTCNLVLHQHTVNSLRRPLLCSRKHPVESHGRKIQPFIT